MVTRIYIMLFPYDFSSSTFGFVLMKTALVGAVKGAVEENFGAVKGPKGP
jgi:hypothetical protein